MSAKYAGLPDIDSAPDVFETPDEPSTQQTSEEPERPVASSSDIDRSGLPPRKKEISYDPSDTDTSPKETHLARLRRLQAEVRELEAELGSDKGTPATTTRPSVVSRQPVDVVGELSSLRERLTLASDSASLAPSAQAPDLSRLDPVSAPTSAPTSSTLASRDSELDRRLASLERLVGSQAGAGEDANLSDTVSRLDHLVSILTQPRHLDSISRRVKLLLADLDRASAASRKGAGGAAGTPGGEGVTLQPGEYEQLQALFALLPRLDPLLPVIPPLLGRLKSLSGLHAEALGVAHDLRELQSAESGVEEQEAELAAVVDGVRTGLGESSTLISKNWESLQARLADLDARVARLNA